MALERRLLTGFFRGAPCPFGVFPVPHVLLSPFAVGSRDETENVSATYTNFLVQKLFTSLTSEAQPRASWACARMCWRRFGFNAIALLG